MSTRVPIVKYPGLHVTLCLDNGYGLGGHGVVVTGGGFNGDVLIDKVVVYRCGLPDYLAATGDAATLRELGAGYDYGRASVAYSSGPGVLVYPPPGQTGYYLFVRLEDGSLHVTPFQGPGGPVDEATLYEDALIYRVGGEVRVESGGSVETLGTSPRLKYIIIDKAYVCLDDSVKSVSPGGVSTVESGGGPYACGAVDGQLAILDTGSGELRIGSSTYTLPTSLSFPDYNVTLSLSSAVLVSKAGENMVAVILYDEASGGYYVVYAELSGTSLQPQLLVIGGSAKFLYGNLLYRNTVDSGAVIVGL